MQELDNLNKKIAVEDTERAFNRIPREKDEVGKLERGLEDKGIISYSRHDYTSALREVIKGSQKAMDI